MFGVLIMYWIQSVWMSHYTFVKHVSLAIYHSEADIIYLACLILHLI